MLLSSLFLAVALAQTPAVVDVTDFKTKAVLITDGKKHYVAVDPERPYDRMFFSGDGKQFAEVRVIGGGKSGDESWSASLWDPRMHGGRGDGEG